MDYRMRSYFKLILLILFLPAGLFSEKKIPDVHYVATPPEVVDRMLEIADIRKNDVLYDLGCGDGRIVIAAARKYGIQARGFDVDPVRIAEAKENAKKAGVEHLVRFEEKDIFTLDLTPASVVTLYLLPRLNVQLMPQLAAMKKGSRIVSHDFDMRGKAIPDLAEKITLEGDVDRERWIYMWKIPWKTAKAQ